MASPEFGKLSMIICRNDDVKVRSCNNFQFLLELSSGAEGALVNF